MSENPENDIMEKYETIGSVSYRVDNLRDDDYEEPERPDESNTSKYVYEWYEERLWRVYNGVDRRQEVVDKMHGVILHLESCLAEKQKLIDELLSKIK